MTTSSRAEKATRVYHPLLLDLYDTWVIKITTPLIWQCPRQQIEQLYTDYAGRDHLEAGVGSGYYLERFIAPDTRLDLTDLNADALAYVRQRLKERKTGPVSTYRHNLLEPFTASGRQYDSIGCNYVLHCIPGTVAEKVQVLDNLYQCLKPGGTLFGSTVVAPQSFRQATTGLHRQPGRVVANALNRLYLATGVFNNAEDDDAALAAAIQDKFPAAVLKREGQILSFVLPRPQVPD